MTLINKFPNIKLQQPVPNWQVRSTDRTPVSVLPIGVGQNVIFSDGYSGKITHLLADKDGRLERFVIQTRGWSRRKVIIPIESIEHIDGEDVYLSIAKYDLKRLPTYRPDDVLVAHVSHVLWADTILRQTDDRKIHVEVENGIAYLSGYVSFPSMSSGAERAALKVDGLWKVENDLTIDSDLKTAVAQAIGNDPLAKKARVFVGVNNGFVTLTGQAPDFESRRAAQEHAVAMPRVRGVINSIRVLGADIEAEDQRMLQPVVGTSIYATDMKIGTVEKVVIDPKNRLVTAILANAVLPEPDQMRPNWKWNQHDYSERRVLIPVETVRHLTSTSVFLKEEGALVAAFNNFDPGSYFPAPEVWEPLYPYKHTDILLPKQTQTA
jgi:osmotically-inducible protein OsmY/sporulation protein YlmC with PRC-barrel domain